MAFNTLRPIHPFPARMAPSIVWDSIPKTKKKPLNILDPMSGSGTTLVYARMAGHIPFGCDMDPLALLISEAWCTDFSKAALIDRAKSILQDAKELSKSIDPSEAYPLEADEETKSFIDFWFDDENKVQLFSLSSIIDKIRMKSLKRILFSSLSRTIITKTSGTSLAMDVSHSRPHRAYEYAPVRAFDVFLKSVKYIADNSPFADNEKSYSKAKIKNGDARKMPFKRESMDLIITSPPYLNAIDYMRGHKLSLVWMGNTIPSLRQIRSNNIGTEVSKYEPNDIADAIFTIMTKADNISNKKTGMIKRYINDMYHVMAECKRVLKYEGRAIFVVGDSSIKDTFVKNSAAVVSVADLHGLSVEDIATRSIPSAHRYLPPPKPKSDNNDLDKRMMNEVIITLKKCG